jgi:Carboxypeptidase regulatory-like domain
LRANTVSAGFTLLFLLSMSGALLGGQVRATQTSTLKGTIKDPSGAAMASVDVAIIQGTTVVKAAKTDPVGVFSMDLPTGQYQLAVTAPDFKVYTQPVRLVPNMPALSITLSLEGITSVVEVLGNTDKIVVDAANSLDATILTAEQIQDLPEDEESLLALLQALAGGEGNAQLIIDGFEGGRLPTRDQIAQIIIEPNSFNANGTGPRITIVSRTPGPTRWAGNLSYQYRDSALNARTPHAENKPSSRRSVITTNYNGPVIRGKLGMTVNLSKQQSESGSNSIRAITADGPVNRAVYSPYTYDNLGFSHNWYFSQTHTLQYSISYNRSKSLNQGIGGITLEDRASDSRDHGWNFQVSDNKTLSPKMTNTFQFRTYRGNSGSTPHTNAVAINVLDAFNSGGAQNHSESRNSSFNLSDNLRWAPTNKWNLQFSLNVNHQYNHNFSENNYLGTFTFSSLADYLAGQPLMFTQTSGNPVAETRHTDANVAAQVTYRIRPTMSYSLGTQYTVQTHLRDYNNFSPTTQFQVQVKKRSTISIGARLTHPNVGFPIFYYEQLIRGDGTTQQFNTVISSPSYPDPFAGGAAGTVTGAGSLRQIRDEHLVGPYTFNTQLSLNQTLPRNWRFTSTFSLNRQVHQIRSRNINAPFPGVPLDASLTQDEIDQLRPFYPNVARINKYESIGNALSRTLTFLVQLPSTKKILKTQISGTFQYGLTWAADDNAWQNPYNIRADWARNDQRQRFQSSFQIRPPKAGSFSFNINANSGRAYSITTGHDDNWDQSTNDRPAGVKRNSLRGPGQYTVNLNYTSPPLNFRKREEAPKAAASTGAAGVPAAQSPQDSLLQSALAAGLPIAAIEQLLASISVQQGIIQNPGAAAPTAPPTLLHPQVTLSVNVQNLFNNTRVNGYFGVITSPLFGRPTGYGPGRSISLSLNTRF